MKRSHERFSGPKDGQDLERAREESGRLWLPILNEQRPLLRVEQDYILDQAAGSLVQLPDGVLDPGRCRWWYFHGELTISLPVEGEWDVVLRTSHTKDDDGVAYIILGRADPDDYDYVVGGDRYVELEFPWNDGVERDEVVASALSWLQDEILGRRPS